MWLLHLLPDGLLYLVVNFVLFTGILFTLISILFFDTIGKYIPSVAPYRTPVRILSILILVFGVYFKGGYSTEMIWREKVAKLETQLKIVEEKSKTINTVIEERVVYKDRIVKQKAKEIIKKIDNPVFVEIEKQCPLPKEAIEIHNEAVDMYKIIQGESK